MYIVQIIQAVQLIVVLLGLFLSMSGGTSRYKCMKECTID